MKRRLRPTLVLRFAIAVASLALVVPLAFLASRMSLLMLIAAVVFVCLGLEIGLVPWLIERSLTRRAEGRPGARSPWFVDVAAEEAAERDRHEKDVEDNSALS